MLDIHLRVNAPLGQAIGVKEAAALYFERYGDTTVVSVTETAPEQIRLEADHGKRHERRPDRP